VDIYENGIIAIDISPLLGGQDQYVVLEPVVENGAPTWACYGQNVPASVLPPACQ
jgi:hypothetical protein